MDYNNNNMNYNNNNNMNYNNNNNMNYNMNNQNNKQTYSAGLILGILSIPCGLIIAITGWILGIIGIVLNSSKKNEYNTKTGLILSIIGLVLSIINSIAGVIIFMGMN